MAGIQEGDCCQCAAGEGGREDGQAQSDWAGIPSLQHRQDTKHSLEVVDVRKTG